MRDTLPGRAMTGSRGGLRRRKSRRPAGPGAAALEDIRNPTRWPARLPPHPLATTAPQASAARARHGTPGAAAASIERKKIRDGPRFRGGTGRIGASRVGTGRVGTDRSEGSGAGRRAAPVGVPAVAGGAASEPDRTTCGRTSSSDDAPGPAGRRSRTSGAARRPAPLPKAQIEIAQACPAAQGADLRRIPQSARPNPRRRGCCGRRATSRSRA